MMGRILQELYYGNVRPSEKQFLRNTPFDRAMHTLADSEQRLMEALEGEEKRLLLDMSSAQGEISGVTAMESFICGFRLGARIILEIMSEDDGCLIDIED